MFRDEREARRYLDKVTGHLHRFVILPSKLSPKDQKVWFDMTALKKRTSLKQAAKYYSRDRKY